MKSKKWLVLLLVFAMILSLAACSKKAANDPAPSTDPVDNSAPVENTAAQNDADVSASTEKTEDKGTVKIGVTGPQTGDYAYQGLGYVAVAEIAAELWNAKDGKCGGYTIEVVDYDDKNSGDEIAVIAEKLAEDPDVMGVIGSYTSGTCMVAAPIFQEYGVVEIASAGHANFATTGDYIFRNNYMVQTESEGCLEAVTKTLGVSKIGILAVDTEWGHSTSEVMIDLMPDLGVELVCDVQYVLEGNDDYSSYVSTFINSGCEAVVCVAMPPQPSHLPSRCARLRRTWASSASATCTMTAHWPTAANMRKAWQSLLPTSTTKKIRIVRRLSMPSIPKRAAIQIRLMHRLTVVQ